MVGPANSDRLHGTGPRHPSGVPFRRAAQAAGRWWNLSDQWEMLYFAVVRRGLQRHYDTELLWIIRRVVVRHDTELLWVKWWQNCSAVCARGTIQCTTNIGLFRRRFQRYLEGAGANIKSEVDGVLLLVQRVEGAELEPRRGRHDGYWGRRHDTGDAGYWGRHHSR